MNKNVLTKNYLRDKLLLPSEKEAEKKHEENRHTDKAPAAIGPYAQAVEIDGLVITSGQLPIDPATGAFPEGIAEQTRQSLTNVKSILAEAGLGMDKVVKTTVFLSDMNNFGAMNEVYATFFGEGGYPARSAVEVARLPKDALVEIEVIAVK